MGKYRNNAFQSNHFRKHWCAGATLRPGFVRTWFKQPARKIRRREHRIKRARDIAPRPTEALRPAVRCPTQKYNMRVRHGRGFSLEELKAAGLHRRFARTIGIAVDHRRRNRSMETLQANVQRLKEYKSRLLLFPRTKKPGKMDSKPEQLKLATQVKGTLIPLRSQFKPEKRRVPTADEKRFSAYEALQHARYAARSFGKKKKTEGAGGKDDE